MTLKWDERHALLTLHGVVRPKNSVFFPPPRRLPHCCQNDFSADFKNPVNTSRLLLNSFKSKNATQWVVTFSNYQDGLVLGFQSLSLMSPSRWSLLFHLSLHSPNRSHHPLAHKCLPLSGTKGKRCLNTSSKPYWQEVTQLRSQAFFPQLGLVRSKMMTVRIWAKH